MAKHHFAEWKFPLFFLPNRRDFLSDDLITLLCRGPNDFTDKKVQSEIKFSERTKVYSFF